MATSYVAIRKEWLDKVGNLLDEHYTGCRENGWYSCRFDLDDAKFADSQRFRQVQDAITHFITPFYGLNKQSRATHSAPCMLVPEYLLKAFEEGTSVRVVNNQTGFMCEGHIKIITAHLKTHRVTFEMVGQGRRFHVNLTDYNNHFSVKDHGDD